MVAEIVDKYLFGGPLNLLFRFARWFYFDFVPFVVLYIGIPLFILGLLMGTAFSLGSLLFIIVFFIAIFYFIKGTIFHNPFKPKDMNPKIIG